MVKEYWQKVFQPNIEIWLEYVDIHPPFLSVMSILSNINNDRT